MSKKAVIAYDGRQFSCAPGDVITVNRITDEVGKERTIGQVIAYVDEDTVVTGAQLKGTEVHATVEAHDRLPKVVARKYRRRKSSRSQHAHRQKITRLKITAIKSA